MRAPFSSSAILLRLTLALLAIALPLVGMVTTAAPAHAEGNDEARDTDWVAQLTDEEITYLESRGIAWAQLDPLRKQRIAHAIVKLREMEPDKREEVVRRLGEAARRHGRDAFAHHNRRSRITKAMMDALYAELPAGTQEAVAQLGSLRRHLDHMLIAQFNKHVFEEEREAALERPIEELPEGAREHVARLRAKLEKVPATDTARRERYERALVWTLIGPRLEEAMRAGIGSNLTDDPAVVAQAILASVRTMWPQAVEKTQTFLAALDKDELVTLLENLQADSERKQARYRLRMAFELASGLLRRVELLAKDDADLAAEMEGLARRLLIERAGVTAERLADLPPAEEGRARMRFLGLLQRELFGDATGQRHGGMQGMPGGRRGAPGARNGEGDRRGGGGGRGARPGGAPPRGGGDRDTESDGADR